MRGELTSETESHTWPADGQQAYAKKATDHKPNARRRRILKGDSEPTSQTLDRHPDPILVTTSGRIVYSNDAGAALLGAESGDDLEGRSFGDFVAQERANDVLDHMRRREKGEPPDRIEYPLVRLDGGGRFVEAYLASTDFDGQPAAHSMLRDITDVQRELERSSALYHAAADGFWCIELAEPIPVSADLKKQAEHVYKSGRIAECNDVMAEMLGAQKADDVSGEVVSEFPLFRGLVEQLVRSRYNLRRWEVETGSQNRSRSFIVNAVGTIQGAEIVRVWGNCTEISNSVQIERRMIASLENQLHEIGQELHDGIGQVATAIGLIGECLKYEFADADGKSAEHVRRLVELTRSVRELVHGVHGRLARPSMPKGTSLTAAIAELCEDQDRQGDAACTFTCEDVIDEAAEEAGEQLYCIVHEALSNAVRHAQASQIDVRLRKTRRENLVVEVLDDGIGFDEASVPEHSAGLTRMYYSARLIGARVTIESSPGAGTKVRCTGAVKSK